MRKTALIIALAVAIFSSRVNLVIADGQYGQGGGEETKEQPKEEVVHKTVEAGLGDNLLVLSAMVAGSALILLLIAKKTARVYFLD